MNLSTKSEASIALIVAVVVGLIIIVVIVLILTGKLGAFGKTTDDTVDDSAQTLFVKCSDACKLLGKQMITASEHTENSCLAVASSAEPKYVAGNYEDVNTGKVCCCMKRV